MDTASGKPSGAQGQTSQVPATDKKGKNAVRDDEAGKTQGKAVNHSHKTIGRTASLDNAALWAEFSQYQPGGELVITEYEPPDPYNYPDYPDPEQSNSNDKVLSEEEREMPLMDLVFKYAPLERIEKGNAQPPDGASNTHHGDAQGSAEHKRRQLRVEIVRLIKGGADQGCQVLLCKIKTVSHEIPKYTIRQLKRALSISLSKLFSKWSLRNRQETTEPLLLPLVEQRLPAGEPVAVGDLVVLKVFDPLHYGHIDPSRGPRKVTTMADGDMSREDGAYRHLWRNKATGYPHIAPQYHGAWKVNLGSRHPAFEGQRRQVGAVMMEYIRGTTIEDLCGRSSENNNLVVPPGVSTLDFEGTKQVRMEPHFMMAIFKEYLRGSVCQLHAGVEHWFPEPENVMVTTTDEGKPRAVLIDYVAAGIDSKRRVPMNYFPGRSPPHPWTHFSLGKLQFFRGWFPPLWNDGRWEQWVAVTFGTLDNSAYGHVQ
ncbi:hypothetical protein CkaCkLH20_01914 [Colletotrichum karsti]|uniref:Uncharacterized protein n=1 Tax=Colletotrichum karsti TaxID=1095194 RepID=A0A9P6ICH2_9PEZI|nr:uncharacterized protein CkaCkLH20_01914 [Colletotrichum karsti]KAF9880872.1 hypothetical protein CkaCkLH20_01914 [Colletotrichum karsti]